MDNVDEVYSFMLRYQEEHGRPPLMREIVENCDLSHRSSVQYIMFGLIERGLVVEVREPGKSRRYQAVVEEEESG